MSKLDVLLKKYKREVDEKGNDVSYYVSVSKANKRVVWELYPHEPEGIHWKAADQMGLGRYHEQKKQTFNEYLETPFASLPEKIHNDIVSIIEELNY